MEIIYKRTMAEQGVVPILIDLQKPSGFNIKEVWATAWNIEANSAAGKDLSTTVSQGHAVVGDNNAVTESCQATSFNHQSDINGSLIHMFDDDGVDFFDAKLVMPPMLPGTIQLNVTKNSYPATQYLALTVIGEDA